MKNSKHILFLLLCFASALSLRANDSTASQSYGNVYVGVYLNDISGFDLKEGRFIADLQLWCKWLGPDEIPEIGMSNGEINSKELIKREDEGDWHSVRWRIQGTFRGTFPLHRFPFDRQDLKIVIDLPERQGQIIPDLAGSGMASQWSITGWLYEPYFEADTARAHYYSDFGSIENEGEPLPVNTVTFEVKLERPYSSYFVKFVLPLAIIILMAFLSFFLPASLMEVRGSMGVTALLSVVAFQFALGDSIPDVSYLVTADQLFISAYIIIIVVIIFGVVNFNIFKKDETLGNRLDRIAYAVLPLVTIIVGWTILADSIEEKEELTEIENHGILPAKYDSEKNKLTFLYVGVKHTNMLGIHNGLIRTGLYRYDEEGNKVPHLLRGIPELTNDLVRFLPDGGMTVQWGLKPGVLWGDGCPITAEDLMFSLEAEPPDHLREVRKLDDFTIEVEYAKRYGGALQKFIVYPKAMYEDAFEAYGTDGVWNLSKHNPPFSDGPYLTWEVVPGSHVTFIRNPYYAGPAPPIDTIKVVDVIKGVGFKDMYDQGIFDVAANVSLPSWLQMRDSSDKVTTTEIPGTICNFLSPDLSVTALQDVDYRRAIAHAVNKQKVVDILHGPNGEVANSYYGKNAFEYPADVTKYEFDPAKARQILASNPFRGHTLKLVAFSRGEGNPEHEVMMSVYNDLRAAGFNVQLDQSKKSVFKKWKSGEHGGLLIYSRSDPNEEVARFWNIPYVSGEGFLVQEPIRLFDEKALDLYNKSKTTLFEERRVALARDLQRLHADRLPLIPVAIGVERLVWPKDVKGIKPGVGGSIWWNVTDWRWDSRAEGMEAEMPFPILP